MRRLRLLTTIAAGMIMASTAVSVSPARADYVLTFSEVGSDVIASGSGTVDLEALTFQLSGPQSPVVVPAVAAAANGAPGDISGYSGASGPTSFGAGFLTFATSGTGDIVGIQGLAGPGAWVFVPTGYVSDDPLSGSATFAGQTLASLGLDPGVYVFTWGSGADADTFTVNIVADAIPEPATLALLGAGLLGLGAARRRRRGAA